MVGTIIPMVHGNRDAKTRLTTLAAHLLGCVSGGVVAGYTLGLIGAFFGHGKNGAEWPAFVFSAICLVVALRELNVLRIPMIESHWQVPRRWVVEFAPALASLLYGVLLGAGVVTRMGGVLATVVVWVLLVGDPVLGSKVLGLFGLSRALPIVVAGAMAQSFDQADRWATALHSWQAALMLVGGVALSWTAGRVVPL